MASKLLLEDIGDSRLAGPGQAGEPQHAGALALCRGTLASVDIQSLPVNILAAPKRMLIMPAPAVALVSGSIRMKDPVDLFCV